MHRRAVAVAAIIYGFVMLADPGDWKTVLFKVPFSLLPIWGWGTCFFLAGAAKVLAQRPWTAAILGGVIGSWTICLVFGVIHGYLRDGHPPTSPAGWVWPAAACVQMFLPESRDQ